MSKPAVIVFGHGSSVAAANESVFEVAARMAEAGAFETVKVAFLEVARPDLPETVGALAATGVREVLVVPYFLTLGSHVKHDLPRIADELCRVHEGMRITIAAPLDGHPMLPLMLAERASQALTPE